jgi:AcrR family transcriptional regulator
VGLRERKKQLTRTAILKEADARFASKGFDATTVDELCEAVDVSKRTFFRYFGSKEDLVFPNHEERLARFLQFLEHAPPELSAFDALRAASRAFAVEYTHHRERFLGQQKLIKATPSLVARESAIDREWESVMAVWFESRLPADGNEPALFAKVMAGAAIGVIRATMRHWYDGDATEDLEALGIAALARLERGFADQ